MASRYGRTLAAPGARRVLVGSVLARLPLGMTLAILLLVKGGTGSFASAGAVVGAFGLAAAGVGPLLGRLVDRLGQPKVLVPCAVVQGVLLTAIVAAAHWHASVPALVALGALTGASLPPVSACVRALWPALAPDQDALESAYALDATVQEVIWTSGPLIVAAFVAFASPAAAVLGMAAVTVAGTLWFAAAPPARAWRAAHAGPPGGALGSRRLRALLATSLGAGLAMGAGEVGLPGIAAQLDHPGATGLLLSLASLGSMIGGLAYGARSRPAPLHRRYAALLMLAGVVTLPLILVDSLPLALAGAFVSGIGWAPMLSCQYSLVGVLAPPGTVTEAFTWIGSAVGGGLALGNAIAGLLIDAAGVSAAFEFAAASAFIAAGFAALRAPLLAPAPR
jgi:MFS family permease